MFEYGFDGLMLFDVFFVVGDLVGGNLMFMLMVWVCDEGLCVVDVVFVFFFVIDFSVMSLMIMKNLVIDVMFGFVFKFFFCFLCMFFCVGMFFGICMYLCNLLILLVYGDFVGLLLMLV